MTMVAPHQNISTNPIESYEVLAFYKFKSNSELKLSSNSDKEDLKLAQKSIQEWCLSINAMGCIIIAHEGINGTICFPCNASNVNDSEFTKELIKEQPYLSNIRMNISYSTKQIFHRLKVKIKSEIVTMGVCSSSSSNSINDDCNNNTENIESNTALLCNPSKKVGTHVKPEQWDNLLDDPNVLVIDTRNTYEIQMGTFQNAINPNTQSFRDFPSWFNNTLSKNYNNSKDDDTTKRASEPLLQSPPKAIAMFCTGGIRCEKATSYALFSNLFHESIPIYHLEGGILSYLNSKSSVPKEKSKFIGECYVFDQRVALSHGLQCTKTYTQCYACRMPLKIGQDTVDDCNYYEFGLSCKYCYKNLSTEQRERFYDRQKQIDLANLNGRVHIHDPKYIGL